MPSKRPPIRVVLVGLFPANTPPSPSLALGSLKAYADSRPELSGRASIKLFHSSPTASLDLLEKSVLDRRPDLVGFTCFIWNIDAVRALAERLKRSAPGVVILVGGHEVMWTPEKVLAENPAIDYVALGEGEATFAELVERLADRRPAAGVPGLAWRDGARIVLGPSRALVDPIESLPSPYTTGAFTGERADTLRLETSRGCPFKCRFCSGWRLGTLWRQFPLSRLDAELAAVLPGAKEIHLVDSDPCAQRERGKEIFRLLGRRLKDFPDVRVLFGSYLGTWDRELAELVAACGRVEMTAGVQSVNPAALRPSRRFFDERRVHRIGTFLSEQPNVQLIFELLLGLPGDDPAGYRRTLDWALSVRRAKVLLTTMLVTPGSDFARDPERDGIEFNPGAPHDVLSTPTFPRDALDEARRLSFWISAFERDDFLRDALWRVGRSLEGRVLHPYLAPFERLARELSAAHPAAESHARRFSFADSVPWESFELALQRDARVALRDRMSILTSARTA